MTTQPDAILADARARLRPALGEALALLDDRNRRIGEYHVGLTGADGRPTPDGGGKMIRGTLALVSARAADTDAAPAGTTSAHTSSADTTGSAHTGGVDDPALSAAVAVELVHQYSLLHDDIIDRDEMRRHRPAAWTVFGTSEALLAGDAMASLALEIAAGIAGGTSAAVVRALSVASRRMAAGQAADLAFETAGSVDLAAGQTMVADKTGALLECAAAIGAIASGAPQSVVQALAAFGRHTGMAFQLVDDIMGLWGASAETGKPADSDLASRKKSLPVLAALAADGPDSRSLARVYDAAHELSPAEIAEASRAVDAAGGRAWAERQAQQATAAALAALEGAPLAAEVRDELTALGLMLCRRTS